MTYLSSRNVHLLPLSPAVPEATLLHSFPQEGILVCHFAVEDAEQMIRAPWDYKQARLCNIYPHADESGMHSLVSSANMVLLWAKELGSAPVSSHIVVNRTHCDSVLSAVTVASDLGPLDILGVAVIVADHSGQTNDIADLLQALDSCRDYELSPYSVCLPLDDKSLQGEVQVAFDERLRRREAAEFLMQSSGSSQVSEVFYG